MKSEQRTKVCFTKLNIKWQRLEWTTEKGSIYNTGPYGNIWSIFRNTIRIFSKGQILRKFPENGNLQIEVMSGQKKTTTAISSRLDLYFKRYHKYALCQSKRVSKVDFA